MSRVFEGYISALSAATGYDYDFLVDKYNEVMDEDGDFEYFVTVSLERDW